jgi:hypothetical protein
LNEIGESEEKKGKRNAKSGKKKRHERKRSDRLG